jgi:putative ABC transport system permease protein
MMRNKLYTLINIFCLSVGITGAILISLFVHHELSYDTFHDNHERIYRVEGIYSIAGNDNHLAITAFPLGIALKEEYSAVNEYVRFFYQDDVLVNIDDRRFLEEYMAFTDSTVFDVFSFPFIHGTPQGALSEPNTVVLTESLGEKYFPGENPIGKTIRIMEDHFMITGIIEDIPSNSHMKLQGLMSINTLDNETVYSLDPGLFWSINTNFTYLLMHPEADVQEVFDDMTVFHQKYTLPLGQYIGGESQFTFTALKDVRFSDVLFSPESASATTLKVLIIVAVFLIIIAAVNYTNLATARASVRSMEIGIRKANGATRLQILTQFLSESIFLAVISLVFSLLLIEFLFPGFNQLAEKSFQLLDLLKWPFVLYIPLIVIITGFLAGAYPAVFVSSLRSAEILKGSKGFNTGGSSLLRKALVVFQFVISIMLITGTLFVEQQLKFLQNKDLGLETQSRAVIRLQNEEVRSRISSLENLVKQNPDVLATTKSLSVPGRGFNKYAVLVQSGNEMVEATITANYIDEQFFDLFGIEFIYGRNFHEDVSADAENSIIINRTAASFFGWNDNALGQLIQWDFDREGTPTLSARVVGVVEDHNLLNLNHPIEPVMYVLPADSANRYHHLIVHYRPGKEKEIMNFLEETLIEFDPENFPVINFVDKGYQEQFESEERLGTIFAVFAVVCIIISFLGLFGLSSFLTEQRKREIGVRKVLGSSTLNILGIFYKEFSLLILLATIIAVPFTWFLLDRWLQEFVYRVNIVFQPFVVSAVLALVVAIITVSFHTIKAAGTNPADILRSE